MNLSKRLAKRLLLVGLLSLCLAGLNGLCNEIVFGQGKSADVNPQTLLDMASARAEVTSEWETIFGLFHATSEKLYQDAQGMDVFEYSDIAKGYLEELAEQLDAIKIPAFEDPVFQALESACSSCAEAYKPYNEAMAVWSLSQCADKLRGTAAKLLEILQQFSQSRFELLYHHDWGLENDVHQRYESIVTEGEMWEAYEAGTLAAPEENPEQKLVYYLNGEVEALQILKTAIEDKITSVMDKSGGFADSYGVYDLLGNFQKFVESDLDYLAAVIALLGPINTAPSANTQSVTTDEDTAVDIALTGDDPDGDPLTYKIMTQPTNGSLTGAAPNVTYTPNPDYNGVDSFTFTVNDSAVDSEPATVSITINPVNDPPVVSTADLFIKEDTSGRIKVEISDVDGDALTTDVFGGPHFGRLAGKLPNLTYTPNKDYNGLDTFTVIARDGVTSGKASVNILIDPVNDAPVAQGQSVTTNEDTPLPIALVASDVDGDPLTYTIMAQPANGNLTGTPPTATYTPNLNYNGPDSFTFTVNDGKVSSAPATVSITINPVNDPPVACIDSISPDPATVGQSVTFSGHGTDVDGPGDVVGHTWDFGDNTGNSGITNQASSSVSHTYRTRGSYTVTYQVQDKSGVNSAPNVTFLAVCSAHSIHININVDINVTPPDINGNASGKAPFARYYSTGTLVTVTASETYWKRKQNADGTWQTLYGTFNYWSDGSGNRVGQKPYPRTISFSKLPTGETYTANYDLDGGSVGAAIWCAELGNPKYIWAECRSPGQVHIHDLGQTIPKRGGILIVEFAPDSSNGCPGTVTVSISPDGAAWTQVATYGTTSNDTCPNNPTPCWEHDMPKIGDELEAFRYVEISIQGCSNEYSAAYVCLPPTWEETVTLTVKAIAEVVEGWLGDIPVTSEKRVSAHITVNNEQVKRITTFTESFPKNSEVTLSAERRITWAGTTYFFDRWEVDGKVDSKREITITLAEDTTCTAFYLPPDYNE